MKIPGIHPNVLRMLTRRGFKVFEQDEKLFVRTTGWVCPIAKGIAHCRALNQREKQARYRLSHKPQINAYMKKWKARQTPNTYPSDWTLNGGEPKGVK